MALSREHFELLRTYIREECALAIGDDKVYLVESRLSPLLQETGCNSFEAFYQMAKNDRTKRIRDQIVDAITTHETLWFRDRTPWRVIEELILPALANELQARTRGRVRIWSAACSTGQETYTLAMIIDNLCRKGTLKARPEQFEILGTDVSPSSIEAARQGRYNQIEMRRGMLPEYEQRYFQRNGNTFEIQPQIRERVQHRVFNLQDNFTAIGKQDIILCRNVLIYFSDDFKRELMQRFANQLPAGGYFFLGSTESGLGHSDYFQLREHQGALYYERR